jgi:hypothetical protein
VPRMTGRVQASRLAAAAAGHQACGSMPSHSQQQAHLV